MNLAARYRGSLLGLAAGDALGTTLEFHPPGTFAPITDMVGGGPFQLEPGEWTDDTSMALCLAESLIERRGFDPVDQLERYVRWYRHGHLSSNGRCFDIGTTARRALERFETTREPWCGPSDPHTAGNGSLMRLAPVVLAHAHDAPLAIHLAAESSRTTHGAREAIDCCRLLAAVLLAALDGSDKAALLDTARLTRDHASFRERPLAPAVAEIAAGSFRVKHPPAIAGTGYAVRSLEAALWTVHRGESFRDGALLAANLGDDADTTAAIYGQLAGAHYGVDAIPAQWRERIARRDLLESFADGLLEVRTSLEQGRA